MSASPDRLQRVARQHLETSRLLGVDFIPVRPAAPSGGTALRAADVAPDGPLGEQPHPQPTVEVMRSATGPLQSQLEFAGSAQAAPPQLPAREKGPTLEALRIRHDATCPHCTTATDHTQTVFGEGDPDARLMFIGEAPGVEEDRTGRPFVGRAGKKLDEMIRSIGLEREQVYIANILKSRPPGNRTPLQPEVDGCAPFLAEQIRLIRPGVIVALGGPAAKFLLQTGEGIMRLRGQWSTYGDGALQIDVMPTFHPAYLLRNYTLDTRKKMWADMQAVQAALSRD